jgi:hypothetical protein
MVRALPVFVLSLAGITAQMNSELGRHARGDDSSAKLADSLSWCQLPKSGFLGLSHKVILYAMRLSSIAHEETARHQL